MHGVAVQGKSYILYNSETQRLRTCYKRVTVHEIRFFLNGILLNLVFITFAVKPRWFGHITQYTGLEKTTPPRELLKGRYTEADNE